MRIGATRRLVDSRAGIFILGGEKREGAVDDRCVGCSEIDAKGGACSNRVEKEVIVSEGGR